MLGDVLEELTLKKTRSAVADLTKMAPQTAVVVQDDILMKPVLTVNLN